MEEKCNCTTGAHYYNINFCPSETRYSDSRNTSTDCEFNRGEKGADWGEPRGLTGPHGRIYFEEPTESHSSLPKLVSYQDFLISRDRNSLDSLALRLFRNTPIFGVHATTKSIELHYSFQIYFDRSFLRPLYGRGRHYIVYIGLNK